MHHNGYSYHFKIITKLGHNLIISSININSSLKSTNSISYEFNLGKYGDFECESNWDLLISAFEMMQSQNGDPGTKYKQIISVPTILKLFVICPLLRLLVENMFKFCLKLDLSL